MNISYKVPFLGVFFARIPRKIGVPREMAKRMGGARIFSGEYHFKNDQKIFKNFHKIAFSLRKMVS